MRETIHYYKFKGVFFFPSTLGGELGVSPIFTIVRLLPQKSEHEVSKDHVKIVGNVFFFFFVVCVFCDTIFSLTTSPIFKYSCEIPRVKGISSSGVMEITLESSRKSGPLV